MSRLGGRKGHSIKSVLGRKLTRDEIKDIGKALKSAKPRAVVASTVSLASSSEKLQNNLSHVFHLFKFVEQNVGTRLTDEKIHQLATEFWEKTKQDFQIKTTIDFDRIFIESAVEAVRGAQND